MSSPCLICGKALEVAVFGEYGQPWGASVFTTPGHYGSTVFDPMDGTSLEIVVCDGCLTGRADRVTLLRPRRVEHPPPVRERWSPGEVEPA